MKSKPSILEAIAIYFVIGCILALILIGISKDFFSYAILLGIGVFYFFGKR